MHLDMRTVYLTYVLGNAIGTGMLAFVWRSNRRRWGGLGWWAGGAACHLAASILVVLRGIVPDLLSIVGANVLLIASPILQYEGLRRFLQQRAVQTLNAIALTAFTVVQIYFTLAQPNLAAREINISAALLVVCAQCAWQTLRQMPPGLRPILRWLGGIWSAYCLTSLVRISLTVALPPGRDFFTESNPHDTWMIVVYQMLFIMLMFTLVRLVNHRLAQELQQQGEALRLSEDKFAKSFHATPDAILITRPSDGRIVEVNEGFCRITGYSREEAVGHSILDLRLWADPQQRAEYLATLRAQPSVRDRESDFITKSGDRLTCLCAGETIELEGETHILTVVRDITASRRVQQEREQLIAELDAFAHTVAHDLKTPLASVIGYTELVEASAGMLPTAAQQHLRTVLWMGRKMANLIDELLVMASLRRSEVEAQPLDMGRIVADALRRLDFMREEHQAQVDVPTEWPTALGHPSWIEEVWANYLSNAMRYGGLPPRVRLGADVLSDGMVRFWVRDRGPGIPAEALKQIFAPKEQRGRVRAQGHGLGLTIVKRIVERLGGQVGAESVLGQGSLFYFTLPQGT